MHKPPPPYALDGVETWHLWPPQPCSGQSSSCALCTSKTTTPLAPPSARSIATAAASPPSWALMTQEEPPAIATQLRAASAGGMMEGRTIARVRRHAALRPRDRDETCIYLSQLLRGSARASFPTCTQLLPAWQRIARQLLHGLARRALVEGY